MTTKRPDAERHPVTFDDPSIHSEQRMTMYLLLVICYLLIGLSLYTVWQKVSLPV
jgi:hypothetical protein